MSNLPRGYGIPSDRAVKPSEDNLCEICMNEDGIETIATHELAGETDSFGTEWISVCDKHKEELNAEETYTCDVCGSEEGFRSRDPSEGSHGRVYYRCVDHRVDIDPYD